MIIRVAVGSTNPCKIDAVREAFEDVFVKIHQQNENNVKIVISSYCAESGVSDQPFGDAETRKGAHNRAQAALSAVQQQNSSDTDTIIDFAVGLEGGLEKSIHPQTNQNELYCMAWMAIVGRKGFICPSAEKLNGTRTDPSELNDELDWSYAKTATFLLPPQITKLVLEQNMELGHADDHVFDRFNSKHGSGTVGVLTRGEIDRKDYYVHALKMGLIPWLWPDLYLSKR